MNFQYHIYNPSARRHLGEKCKVYFQRYLQLWQVKDTMWQVKVSFCLMLLKFLRNWRNFIASLSTQLCTSYSKRSDQQPHTHKKPFEWNFSFCCTAEYVCHFIAFEKFNSIGQNFSQSLQFQLMKFSFHGKSMLTEEEKRIRSLVKLSRCNCSDSKSFPYANTFTASQAPQKTQNKKKIIGKSWSVESFRKLFWWNYVFSIEFLRINYFIKPVS